MTTKKPVVQEYTAGFFYKQTYQVHKHISIQFFLTSYMKNNRQYESLETLENKKWVNTTDAPTNLVRRCVEPSKIPIADFSASDLRIMIGQQFGLPFLIPLALDKLQNDIFIEADFYEGDLLSNVLNIDTSFWNDNETYWTKLNNLMNHSRQQLSDMKISTTKFDNAKR